MRNRQMHVLIPILQARKPRLGETCDIGVLGEGFASDGDVYLCVQTY